MKLHDKAVTSVAQGAALLDKKRPGWDKEISIQKLSIIDGERCVLGQLYGEYLNGLSELNLEIGEARIYGFAGSVVNTSLPSSRTLTTVWKRFIQARREQEALQ